MLCALDVIIRVLIRYVLLMKSFMNESQRMKKKHLLFYVKYKDKTSLGSVFPGNVK